MTINSKGSNSTRIPINTLNTIIDQISDLQEDVGTAKTDINNLETGLGQTNTNVSALQNQSEPIYNKVTASTFNGGNINGNIATVDTINVTTINAGNIEIDSPTQTISAPFGNITELNANTVDVAESVNAKNLNVSATVNAAIIKTAGITNTGSYNGQTINGTIITGTAINTNTATVTDKANVKDVAVSGTITGISDVDMHNLTADIITTSTVNADKVITGATIMSEVNHLAPITPLVDNNDRYTIELPSFIGTVNIVWKDVVNDIMQNIWMLVVTGNGKSYDITWETSGSEVKVTDLFQYDNKLYIRTSANGSMYYSYNTASELDEIHIYYNMGGWGKEKSLEELTELNKTHYVADVSGGTVIFGSLVAPGFTVKLDKLETDEIIYKNENIINYHTTKGYINENLIYRIVQHTSDYSKSAFGGLFYEITDFISSEQIPDGAKLIYAENGILKFCTTYPAYSGLQFGTEAEVTANKTWFNGISWMKDTDGNVITVNLDDFEYQTPIIKFDDEREVATQKVISFVDYRENATDALLDQRSAANTDAIATKIPLSQKGVANGVATLDANGRLPTTQLPTEALVYKGQWDASTGKYPTQTSYVIGDFWIVSKEGTINDVKFYVGDWIIWNGTSWDRSANTNAVASVNGKTGKVEITYSDVDALPADTINDDSTATDKVWSANKVSKFRTIKNVTREEYDALSTDKKNDGNVYNITDEDAGIMVLSDIVEDDNLNAVTSNAVSKALADYTKTSDFESKLDEKQDKITGGTAGQVWTSQGGTSEGKWANAQNAVTSVQNKTGAVTLSATTTINKTGSVTASASSVTPTITNTITQPVYAVDTVIQPTITNTVTQPTITNSITQPVYAVDTFTQPTITNTVTQPTISVSQKTNTGVTSTASKGDVTFNHSVTDKVLTLTLKVIQPTITNSITQPVFTATASGGSVSSTATKGAVTLKRTTNVAVSSTASGGNVTSTASNGAVTLKRTTNVGVSSSSSAVQPTITVKDGTSLSATTEIK